MQLHWVGHQATSNARNAESPCIASDRQLRIDHSRTAPSPDWAELTVVVANTDSRWHLHFKQSDQLTRVDEVNFWRPSAQDRFRALKPGGPFFFRLKAPVNAVIGFGFFAAYSKLSIQLAWDVFGVRNGVQSRAAFESRIRHYRSRSGRSPNAQLGCIIIREAVFLPRKLWVPWGPEQGWPKFVQGYMRFGLSAGTSVTLEEILRLAKANAVPDLRPEFELLHDDSRTKTQTEIYARPGQRTFRARLLDAYGRCAVTGEHAFPVLDAAHIQKYLGPASNHPQNGIVLRTDLHRLYDAGYVTVTPDRHLEVSSRLREDSGNGERYYQWHGKQIHVPGISELNPSPKALDWHATNVFQ